MDKFVQEYLDKWSKVKLGQLNKGDTIEGLCQGSIDMHLHAGPEPVETRLDAVEVALEAQEYGLKAIVLKNIFYPTAPLAYIAQKSAPNVSVFGSLCLEYETGGLNPFAVEAAARLGTKIIYMPTQSSTNSRRVLKQTHGYTLKGDGISLLDQKGQLVPEVTDILEIARKHEMVVATGHISPREIFALVDEARKVGVSKLVVTHALATLEYEEGLTIEEHEQLAEKGVFIEHVVWNILPTANFDPPPGMAEFIRRAGPEHCIMCSDLGRAYVPTPPEGMRIFISTALRWGFSEDEIEQMVKINPGRLLGI